MTTQQEAFTPATKEGLRVAEEMAEVFGVAATSISSYTAWNRLDFDGRNGTIRRPEKPRGGAMHVQCFYRTEEGERNKIIAVDDDRRPFSAEVTDFLGGIAAQRPTSECISFIDEKL